MRPSDVPTRDWNLYYNHTIMNHEKMGVMQVIVSENALLGRKLDHDRWRPLDPELLSCLWPRACAINWNNQGLYVARRSRREARRSATLAHYYVAYGNIRGSMHNTLLAYMCMPNEYPTVNFSYDAILGNSRESIAITPELILAPASKGCTVIYKMDTAGTLLKSESAFDNASYIFTPSCQDSPASRRAAFRLQKEGILCQ